MNQDQYYFYEYLPGLSRLNLLKLQIRRLHVPSVCIPSVCISWISVSCDDVGIEVVFELSTKVEDRDADTDVESPAET